MIKFVLLGSELNTPICSSNKIILVTVNQDWRLSWLFQLYRLTSDDHIAFYHDISIEGVCSSQAHLHHLQQPFEPSQMILHSPLHCIHNSS